MTLQLPIVDLKGNTFRRTIYPPSFTVIAFILAKLWRGRILHLPASGDKIKGLEIMDANHGIIMAANIVSLMGSIPGLFHSLFPVLCLQLISVERSTSPSSLSFKHYFKVTSRVVAVQCNVLLLGQG